MGAGATISVFILAVVVTVGLWIVLCPKVSG
jgi:hypothetical protein